MNRFACPWGDVTLKGCEVGHNRSLRWLQPQGRVHISGRPPRVTWPGSDAPSLRLSGAAQNNQSSEVTTEMPPRAWPAKVGTIPMLIYLRYNYKLEKGQHIQWREAKHGSQWSGGIVDEYDEEIDRLFLSRF